jgi:hypothetical protein
MMAAVSAPRELTGRSLLGKLALFAQARAKARRGTSRLAPFIADHSGTLAALGLIDTGLWHANPVAGWIGAGVSLLVAELKIRG